MQGRDPSRSRTRRSVAIALALLAGLALAGLVATRALVARAERRYPPLGRYVELRGLRQHVLERGAGPPVVLLHGAFGGVHDWDATVLGELATRYRCVAWDRPGHGYSERATWIDDPGDQARLLLALIEELELERPLVVGFSYGGAVALAAALEAPEELRGLVLVNAPSHPWPWPVELANAFPGLPLVGWLSTETFVAPLAPLAPLLAPRAIAKSFAPEPVPTAFAASPVALALRPASYRANAEDMRTLKPFLRAQVDRYPRMELPVTQLVAPADRVVGARGHAGALHAALPRSWLLEAPGAGHQLLYARPERVVQAVDAAIARR